MSKKDFVEVQIPKAIADTIQKQHIFKTYYESFDEFVIEVVRDAMKEGMKIEAMLREVKAE